MEERLKAHGHHNVTAEHASTVEVTTDEYLTAQGDCIVGVAADKSPAEFDPAFRQAAQDTSASITMTIRVGDLTDRIVGRGDPALTFASERSLVARTSTYVDDRTILVDGDGAAADLDRELVQRLADGHDIEVILTVDSPE